MRRSHFTCSPSHIQARARREVRTLLDWHDVGPLAVDTIARVLWLMATLKASLHAIATRFVWPVGETTLRRGIAGQLPDPATLADALHRRLLAFVPRRRPAKGYLVAIDTHGVGFYGRRNTPGTVGGQRKNGTRRYFLYATAVVVERGQRYTLALAAVESGRPMDALVPLLDQIAAAGIKVRKLLLDKGFFAAEVFDLLATRRLPYIAAVPHRRHHGPRNLWAAGDDTHHTLTSHARRGRRVSVRLRLVRTTWTHRDGSVSEQVYAVRGLRGGADLGAEARRWYKRRFGIESSYRQLRQAKAPTTGKDRSWRLLLIGLALLFRQIWVALTQAAVAGGSRWSPQTALERLRQQMAADLVRGLDEHHTVRLHHGSASEFTGKSR